MGEIVQSKPSRPAVVFLHGIGGAAAGWAPQVDAFDKAGYHPVPLDLPGYGLREPVERMTFEDLAADVEAVLEQEKLQRPILVGHSMGGMIAQTLLRRRPDGYSAAVLIGTSPAFGNPEGDFQKQFVQARLAPLESGASMQDLASQMVDGMMGPTPDLQGRALAIGLMGATAASTYRAAVLCLVTFDERTNLAKIRCPVLCLVGEHDRNAPPKMMERMAAKIPGAQYVCLPGVGHLPNLEAPQAFDKAVLDFLTSATVVTA